MTAPTDFSHLDALEMRLSNERLRLAAACKPSELAFRAAVVASVEREIAGERQFMGLAPLLDGPIDEDALLAELFS